MMDLLIVVKRADDSKGNCQRAVFAQSYLHFSGVIRCDVAVGRNFGTDPALACRAEFAGVFLKSIYNPISSR